MREPNEATPEILVEALAKCGAKERVLGARIVDLETALRRALKIIDCPHYRDIAGMRPNADPSVDGMRELLNAGS